MKLKWRKSHCLATSVVGGDYGGEGSTDVVTTLNDLGPKFEKGGKDVKKMTESAVLRENINDGKAFKHPSRLLD